MNRRARTPCLVLGALLATLFARSAIAQATPTALDKATAEALFEDALRLMGAKTYAEACPKLEESERLDPAMGTRFRLAECYEAIGRTASAWAGFAEVADQAGAAGQGEREKAARERSAKLLPKLARLTITVPAPEIAGLEIRRGDLLVGRGQWGVAIPLDPGTYAVTATAPGKRPWRGSLVVASADGTSSTLVVPALEDAVAALSVLPLPAPFAPMDHFPVAPATLVPRVQSPHPGSQGLLGVVVMGAGVVGVAASGVLGLVAKSQYDGAGNDCQGSICDANGKRTTDGARTVADGATVAFALGAVATVGGLVLWLTAPSSAPAPPSVGVRFGPRGALLEGSF